MKQPAKNIRKPASVRYGAVCVMCLPVLCVVRVSAAGEAPDAAEPVRFILSDRYLYDDNLFHLPDGPLAVDPDAIPDPALEAVPERSRDDYINRASAGIRVRLDAARQVFHADARIDDVRYQENDDLDYTGGMADVLWDWQVASNWSSVESKIRRSE